MLEPTSPGHEGAAPVDPADQIDLRAYWRTIVRRRWVIIPFVVAVVLVTLFVTLRQTKIYDATCTIIIELSAPKVLDDQQVKDVVDVGSGTYWYSKEYYETEYKVLTSRAVAQRVVDKLHLNDNLAFLGLDKIEDPAKREQARQRADAAAIAQGRLHVEPVKDSRMVRLRVEDPDPQLAAALANAFAEAYIAENLAVKTRTTESASEWLEKQLADLQVKLDKSSQALFDFKKDHDILSTSWEDRQSMVSQRLVAINTALTDARIKKATLQARNEQIQTLGKAVDADSDDVESLSAVADNKAIQDLKLHYLEAKAECAELQVNYGPKHPKLEVCEEKLGLARLSLQHEIKSALEAAQREYEEVAKTERNLQELYNDTKLDAFNFNKNEREYAELKQRVDNNQRLYDLVMKRLKDASVTGLLQMSNVRVLDRARVGKIPIKPNLKLNFVAALLVALFGGMGLAFGLELLDNTVTTQQQIEERLGLSFLGIIPSIRGQPGVSPDLVVHSSPKSPAAECARSIRTNLLFMSPEKPLKTILVTSSGPQDGKTTTAISLAITMAESGSRVLLVDADMRRPRIHRAFGVPNADGLSSLIVNKGSVETVVRATEVPNLSILPCGPLPPNPAELLHTKGFAELMEKMGGRFDRIVFDSPPVGAVSDALVMSAQMDGTVVVLKAGRTSRELARRSVRALMDVNARLLGAILNDLDLEDRKYEQYYYYYSQYGYYYGNEGQAS